MKESLEHLPIGLGAEIRKEAKTLPTVEVKNEVFWVNPAFDGSLSLDLEIGEPAKLGAFLTESETPTEPQKKIEVWPEHERSGILGRAVFKDKDGNLYRDIDLKGMGHSHFNSFSTRPHVKPTAKRPVLGYAGPLTQAEGILGLADALASKDKEEEFIKLGIRTSRTVAIMLLEEVPDAKGGKISIAEAKQKGQIPEELVPALAVRAFRTKHRISDFDSMNVFYEDARRLVAAEFGFDLNKFDEEAYFQWFAETLGENLGRMHLANYCHQNLSNHNITLDCRIVGLDSVGTFEEVREAIRQEIKSRGKTVEPPSIDVLKEEELLLAEKDLKTLFFNLFVTKEVDPHTNMKRRLLMLENFLDIFKQAYDAEIAKK